MPLSEAQKIVEDASQETWHSNRRRKILSGLGNLSTLVGVEIGALDFPLLLRSQGQVLYVDYADTDTLRAKYANFPDHNAEKIVEVDAIWGENTLAQALGDGIVVDYVVASHVIEHVPDILSWFDEIRAILRACLKRVLHAGWLHESLSQKGVARGMVA